MTSKGRSAWRRLWKAMSAYRGHFREVLRVLRRDGVLWLNLGDTYNAYNGNRGPSKGRANRRHHEFMPALPKRLRPDLQDAQAQGFVGRAVAGGAGLAKRRLVPAQRRDLAKTKSCPRASEGSTTQGPRVPVPAEQVRPLLLHSAATADADELLDRADANLQGTSSRVPARVNRPLHPCGQSAG